MSTSQSTNAVTAISADQKTLAVLFASWNPAFLAETVISAKQVIARHGGDIQKARDAISDCAYGNVSVSCRAVFRAIDDVLRAMQAGYTEAP